MDEVHYLADRFRGAVWEEVIIHLPEDVQVVSLSATVSNAEEFGDWLAEVRGNHAVIVSEHRPVPLWQHMLVGTTMFDLFAEDADPALGTSGPPARVGSTPTSSTRSATPSSAGAGRRPAAYPGARGGRTGRRGHVPRGPGGGPAGRGFARGGRPGGGATRAEVVEQLDRRGAPPGHHLRLQQGGLRCGRRPAPRRRHEAHPCRRGRPDPPAGRGARVDVLGDEDLAVLGYWDFLEGLTRAFAAHHAGMLPPFREIVEELFTAGRSSAVFATETLALGHQHARADRRPREARQVQRRDPRRHHPRRSTPSSPGGPDGAASTSRATPSCCGAGAWTRRRSPGSPRPGPTRSGRSFRPTYNMAVNLVAQVGRRRRPRDPRDVVRPVPGRPRPSSGWPARCVATRRPSPGYAEAMHCHLGDFRSTPRCAARSPTVEKQGAKAAVGEPAGRGRPQPGVPPARRRRPGPDRSPRRVGRRRRPRPGDDGWPCPGPDGRHRGPPAPPAHPRRRPRAGRAGDAAPRVHAVQREVAQGPARPRSARCEPPFRTSRRGGPAGPPRRTRTPACRTCGTG